MYSQANIFLRGAIPVNQISIIPPSKVKLLFFESSYTSQYIIAFGWGPW